MRVVGDNSVAAVLRNDADGDDDCKPPPVALRLEEVEVAGSFGDLLLEPKRLLDFPVFELHGQVVLIAVGVILGQSLQRILVPVPGDEPSGRFRNP